MRGIVATEVDPTKVFDSMLSVIQLTQQQIREGELTPEEATWALTELAQRVFRDYRN